jgi:polyisoprenoid-binding protein YceI
MTEASTAQAGTRMYEGVTIPVPGTFDLDPAHTTIGFSARHLMVSRVRGQFTDFTGSITVAEDPMASSAEATIKTASIDTRQPDRDAHLTSADFLEVEKYPDILFRTVRVTARQGGTFTILGDLTIKDVTREVELTLELEGVATTPYGKQVLGFSLTGEIDRDEFGITYNMVLETGGVMISKNIKIDITGEAARRD